MNRFPRTHRPVLGNQRLFSWGIIGFVILTIAGYTLAKTKDILIGPRLVIEYPSSGITVHNELVTIIGRAQNISSVSMGSRPIFTDEGGYFEEKLLVPYGYSILKLTARDRFDREVTKTIELVYN